MATVKFSWNIPVLNDVERQMTVGLLNLGNAIAKAEQERAPVKDGTLVESIEAKEDGKNKAIVRAGGGSVHYAYRRNFENKLHPNKRLFAQRGAAAVVRGDITKYFKIGDKA